MQLTQQEIIQLLRRRRGLNQGQLGAKAFGTGMDAGRTKIKNIELGRQKPTKDDLNKLALALGVSIGDLAPGNGPFNETSDPDHQLAAETAALFPGLAEYFDLLNKAVQINDHELIGYISSKISDLFANVHLKKTAGT